MITNNDRGMFVIFKTPGGIEVLDNAFIFQYKEDVLEEVVNISGATSIYLKLNDLNDRGKCICTYVLSDCVFKLQSI